MTKTQHNIIINKLINNPKLANKFIKLISELQDLTDEVSYETNISVSALTVNDLINIKDPVQVNMVRIGER